VANEEAVRAAKGGGSLLAAWTREAGRQNLDLSGADLAEADLRWVNFAGANLEGCNFRNADLTGCYFGPLTFGRGDPYVRPQNVPVNIRGACFDFAMLLAATFNYPLLERASFRDSYLGLATFRLAAFEQNDLSRAHMVNTAFLGCDLRDASGLESVRHAGPSHIDWQTLRRSPNLSRIFLSQTGMSDSLLDYAPELVSERALNYHSCFISHATADRPFCDRLYQQLSSTGVRVWYAPEDIRGGEQLVSQLTKAIDVYDKLILVLSENSVRSSWVGNEIKWALRREEKHGRQMLFPISVMPFERLREWHLIDADSGLDIAARVRSYYIPDFRQWETDAAFDREFERLLRDLRASELAA
jgi:uncharacterized protein YjbI with pentapeptide repeats